MHKLGYLEFRKLGETEVHFVVSFYNHTLLAVDMAPAIFAVECMACVWCPIAITRELTFIFLAFCFRRFTSCLAKVVAA